MATEYKLSYTANEINEKLGKIDNISWEDINNKPFGETIETIELIPLSNYQLSYSDNGWECYGSIQNPQELHDGDILTVTFDGVKYTCIATLFYEDIFTIGNADRYMGNGEGTGEPFWAVYSKSNNMCGFGTFEEAPEDSSMTITHSLEVVGELNVIKKVDTKFLYQPDWNDNNTKSFSFIKNKPFGYIQENEVVFDETIKSLTTQISGEYTICMYMMSTENRFLSVKGGTYKVEFNNTEYEVTVNNNRLGDIDNSEEIPFELGRGMIYWKVPTIEYENGNTTAHFKVTFLYKANDDSSTSYYAYIPIDSDYLPSDIILPSVTSSDNGKGLVVQDGEWTVGEVGSGSNSSRDDLIGLPEVTASDNGKFLQVVNSEWKAVSLTNVSEVGA